MILSNSPSEVGPHVGAALQGESAAHPGDVAAADHAEGHLHQLHAQFPRAGRRERHARY